MPRPIIRNRFPRTQALLKAAMEAQGFTLTELASAPDVNITRQMVGHWVSGVEPLSWSRLPAVADCLKIDQATMIMALANDHISIPVKKRRRSTVAKQKRRK